MTCSQCKFYRDGVCIIPMWVDGNQYAGSVHRDEDPACTMFEEGSDAVSG